MTQHNVMSDPLMWKPCLCHVSRVQGSADVGVIGQQQAAHQRRLDEMTFHKQERALFTRWLDKQVRVVC
jgi:hypothetical protein